MNNKGFSLVEFLIAMVIMLWLLMMTTYTFQRVTHRAKDSTSAISTGEDQLSALELLRLDLEHAGFGIAEQTFDGADWKDSEILPIEWNSETETLTINSSLENANPTQNTLGWASATCQSGVVSIDVDMRATPNQDSLWIDADDKYRGTGDTPPCPSGEDLVLIGYPYDAIATDTDQPYNEIVYSLSTNQDLDICNGSTRNLQRAVDGAKPRPVYNCVAGLRVRFTVWDDKDNDGDVDEDEILTDQDEIDPSSPTVGAVRDRLIATTVYMLVQIGKKDLSYTFPGNFEFEIDDVPITFDTPDDFEHYRWKIIKISAPLQGR